MQTIKFIRNYYLYFYFHITELRRIPGEPSFPLSGFAAMVLLVMAFHSATVLYVANALLYDFINDSLRDTLFVFRGNINGIILLEIFISIILTYFMCCYKIKYQEIELRLKQHAWLAKRSAIKLILLPVISVAICIGILNFLY